MDNFKPKHPSWRTQFVIETHAKLKERMEAWKLTMDSDVVKRTNGKDYAKGYMDGLQDSIKIVEKMN